MLAIQSMEGPPRPLPGPPPSLVGPEPAEARQPKPKTLPCKYCSKRFRSVISLLRISYLRVYADWILEYVDVSSTYSAMSVLTPRRSHSHVDGIAAERHSGEGTFFLSYAIPRSPFVPPGHSYTVLTT